MKDSSAKRRGLLIRASKTEGGKVRVSLDDVVELAKTQGPECWTQEIHVTAKEYDPQHFESLKLDEKELADIGYYVLARVKTYKTHT